MENINLDLIGPIKVTIAGNVVEIPKMKFKTGGEFFKALALFVTKERGFALEILALARKSQATLDPAEMVSLISKKTPALFSEHFLERISKLLEIISEGAVTEKIIGECPYSNVLDLLRVLIDLNFGSLKNLEASLQAITLSDLSK